MDKKKETKIERKKRLNTRMENPHEDLRRAIEKVKVTANIDDASAASAIATTDDHINNIVKKDISHKQGGFTTAANINASWDAWRPRFWELLEQGYGLDAARRKVSKEREAAGFKEVGMPAIRKQLPNPDK